MSSLAEQKVRKQLGEKIRELRDKSGITQDKLAIDINSSSAYISHVEKGLRPPSVSFLIKVSYRLKVELWELFKF